MEWYVLIETKKNAKSENEWTVYIKNIFIAC